MTDTVFERLGFDRLFSPLASRFLSEPEEGMARLKFVSVPVTPSHSPVAQGAARFTEPARFPRA
jgi:hypothetical protein